MSDILGPDGKPVKAESIKTPERALGLSGIEFDYVSEGLTPGALAQLMRDADAGDIAKQAQLFDQMIQKDGHLQAEFGKRRRAVLNVEWTLEAGDSSAEAKKALELVKANLDRLRMRALYEALQYRIGYGFAAVELMWQIVNSQSVVSGLKYQKQRRFKFEAGTDRPLVYVKGKDDPVKVDPFRLILAKYGGLSGDPKTGEVFRACAWYYLFKNYTLKDWLVFAEVYGMPLRVGTFQPGADDDQKNALRVALRMLGSDGAGIIPDGTKIEFISHKGTGGADIYERLAKFCEAGMSKVLVGQTLSAEIGNTGSYAAAKTHREVALDLTEGDAWEIAEILEDQLFTPLVGFNLGWDVPVPKLKTRVRGREDEETRLKVVQGAVELGVPVGVEWFQNEFRIPAPAENEGTLSQQTDGTTGKALKAARRGFMALSGKKFTQDQQMIEDVVDELAGKLGKTREAVQELILKTVDQAVDYEDLQHRLLSLVEERSPEFETILERAMFAADLWGRVNG